MPIRRHHFITVLDGAAAWPLAAGARQDELMRRVGVLFSFPETDQQWQAPFQAFRAGLADLRRIARQRDGARELVALSGVCKVDFTRRHFALA